MKLAGLADPELVAQSLADPLMETANILDLLSHLVEKSLVVTEVGSAGVERCRLLETVRQDARERLIARAELEEVQRRHAADYAALAVEAGRHLLGGDR